MVCDPLVLGYFTVDHKKSDGLVIQCQVPGVASKRVEDLVGRSQFFFHLQMQVPQAPCLSHLSGIEVARALSGMALV